ncbi:MAG: hypothetical protein ACXWW4_11765 [Candidatus Binatia bacterium]
MAIRGVAILIIALAIFILAGPGGTLGLDGLLFSGAGAKGMKAK